VAHGPRKLRYGPEEMNTAGDLGKSALPKISYGCAYHITIIMSLKFFVKVLSQMLG
jgi:hypothetical protein